VTTDRNRAVAFAVLAASVVGLSGCSSISLESLPAPAEVAGATYQISATFNNVQTLTPGAKVKLGGAVIGDVSSITTHNYVALVRMDIVKRFALGKDSHFQVRFTTPLGEDYISVVSSGASAGVLTNGAQVGLAATADAPGIEDTFAALSTLLNGGGLSNLHTIATELNTALNGRAGTVRDTLDRLHVLVANLDAKKTSIDNTLDGLRNMATALNHGDGVVQQALAQFPATIHLLATDTHQVRQLLAQVGILGQRVNDLLTNGQQYMLAQFDELRPTLDALRRRDSTLIPTFKSLIRFGKLFDRATPGDYLDVDGIVSFLLNAPAGSPSPGGSSHGQPSRSAR
jgi:phospholipid/cholesterol/gamma-HCH transport system substrate-binding protein